MVFKKIYGLQKNLWSSKKIMVKNYGKKLWSSKKIWSSKKFYCVQHFLFVSFETNHKTMFFDAAEWDAYYTTAATHASTVKGVYKRIKIGTPVLMPLGHKIYVGLVARVGGVCIVSEKSKNDSVGVIWYAPCKRVPYPEATEFERTLEEGFMLREWMHVLIPADATVHPGRITLHQPLCKLFASLLTPRCSARVDRFRSVDSAWKVNVNQRLAAQAEFARGRNSEATDALYLDGKSALTTRTLLAYTGYKLANLHVANDVESTHASLRAKFPGLHLYAGSFQQFVEKGVSKRLISFVWFDGMATWANTKKAVTDACHRIHFASHAVIAVTISTRGVAKENWGSNVARALRVVLAPLAPRVKRMFVKTSICTIVLSLE